jgi:5-methyltetrahydrofolate--homocysteine methyltransferase
VLWKALRSRPGGFKFRRQHAIHQYVVDFYCVEARIIVEVDGPVHEGQREQDQLRTDFLRTLDLEVLRFTNEDVLTDLRSVVARIEEACYERGRNDLPSPRKGKGPGVR